MSQLGLCGRATAPEHLNRPGSSGARANNLVGRRLFLCERLVALSRGSAAIVPALVTIADCFGRVPSDMLS